MITYILVQSCKSRLRGNLSVRVYKVSGKDGWVDSGGQMCCAVSCILYGTDKTYGVVRWFGRVRHR